MGAAESRYAAFQLHQVELLSLSIATLVEFTLPRCSSASSTVEFMLLFYSPLAEFTLGGKGGW